MPSSPDWLVRRQQRRARLAAGLVLLGMVAVLGRMHHRRPPRHTAPTGTQATVAARADGQPLVERPGLRLLSLRGPAHDVGRQYGTLLKPQIEHLVTEVVRRRCLAAAHLDAAAAQRWASAIKRQLPQNTQDLVEGIAEGSGVPLTDVVLLNALPALGASGTSCGFAMVPPATRDKDVLVGWGLDLAGEGLADEYVVLAMSEEGSKPYLGVCLAGQVAPLAVMNAAGLVVAWLKVAEPATGDALPAPFLIRRVAQQADGVEAAQALLSQPTAGAGNVLLVQTTPRPDAAVSELGGATVKQRAQRNGLVVVSNHQRATAKPVLTPEATGACERYDRLWAWLHDHAGVVGERDNPLQAAGSYTERNVVSLEFQPQTRSVTVATGLRAAERPRWRLIWDPDQGVVRASPPDAPSRP